jgi:hypothetical protein
MNEEQTKCKPSFISLGDCWCGTTSKNIDPCVFFLSYFFPRFGLYSEQTPEACLGSIKYNLLLNLVRLVNLSLAKLS